MKDRARSRVLIGGGAVTGGKLGPFHFMDDTELKAILEETHPVLPGQEARAYLRLQERMGRRVFGAPLGWRWPSLVGAGAAFALLVLVAIQSASPPVEPISASSQIPGVFATAFYSQKAKAQVVWLDGLEPAHADGPTYLDRSGQLDERTTKQPDDSL